MLVAAEKEINGKPTVLQCIVGFFVDSAWEMKFFFIFRVELIFNCYICTQKSAKSGGASAIEKHFIAFSLHRLCHQKSTERISKTYMDIIHHGMPPSDTTTTNLPEHFRGDPE